MDLRYFDERYYLSDYFKNERNFLLELKSSWDEICKFEEREYSNLINDYYKYLKCVLKLLNEITLNKDELTKINILRFLIMNGVFSNTNKFIIDTKAGNILLSKSGIGVVEGIGCCRHISEFISDVMPECRVLTCLEQTKNQFESQANHVINLVNYNGVSYGFDALNKGNLFRFISSLNMKDIKCVNSLYYKPYVEITHYKRTFEEIEEFLESNKAKDIETITCLKELLIKFKAYMAVVNSNELIKDFRSDNKEEIKLIKEQIKEIRSR